MTAQVRLFGGVSAFGAGATPVVFPSRREKELLACLALDQGKPVGRDILLERIWQRDDLAAKKALNTSLWRLRSALRDTGENPADWLDSDADALVLHNDPATGRSGRGPCVDVTLLRNTGMAANPETLLAGLDLYTGHVAPELAAEWIDDARRGLEALYLSLLVRAVENLAAKGMYQSVAPYARKLVEQDPFEETGWRALMSVELAAGHTRQALLLYRELEKRLSQELGTRPSARTVALIQPCLPDAAAARKETEQRILAIVRSVENMTAEMNKRMAELRLAAESLGL